MKVTFKGKDCQLIADPVKVGEKMPDFTVINKDKKDITTANLLGKPTLISVVPNINTPVCSVQTKKFNQDVDQFGNVNFLTVSTNTVEDQQKWCAAEGVKKMQLVSDNKREFGKATGLLIPDLDILARSVFVLDQDGKIVYREIVGEITNEPNYEQALSELKKLN